MEDRTFKQLTLPTAQNQWHWLIRDDRTLTSTQKAILHVIASRWPTVFPSYQTIADDSGFSRRTVIRTIDELVALGWLAKKSRTKASGDRDSNEYHLSLPDGTHSVRISKAGGKSKYAGVVTQDHYPSDTGSLGVVTQDHPNIVNLSNKEVSKPDSPVGSSGAIVRREGSLAERSEVRGAASTSLLAASEASLNDRNRGSDPMSLPKPDKKLYMIPGIPGLIPDRYEAMRHPKKGQYQLVTDQDVINRWHRGELELIERR